MSGVFANIGAGLFILAAVYAVLGGTITPLTVATWGVSNFILAGACWLIEHLQWKDKQ